MKIATWNVNSVRARLERVVGWVEAAAPDALALQETKVEDEKFPVEPFRALGYETLVHGQKTYNGVALLAKTPLAAPERGFGDRALDAQARFLAAEVAGLTIASAYVPNGQAVGSEAFTFKLAWLGALARWVEARRGRPLVVMGDFNVAPEPIDVHDPVAWEGHVLFTREERDALAAVVAAGLVDLVRAKNPDLQSFTWWDYRMLAFPKNRGLRIDHVLASPDVAARVTTAIVDREARKGKQPSDHAPVVVEIA